MEEQFGNRLTNLRKMKGLSQEDLGNLIGVSRQTVSKWESNQTTPEMDKLIGISDVFEISVDELLGREKPIQSNSQKNPSYEDLNEKLDSILHLKKLFHFEHKSKKTIGNLPLVHINVGFGMYRAKGIISIGMISTGIISMGLVSLGVISIGVLSLGIIALGALAAGIIAGGSIALGVLAFGAISIGYFSVGAFAIGVYSIGADAMALKIAAGDVASGHIAIGKSSAKGSVELLTKDTSAEEIKAAILAEYPDTWDKLVNIFSSFGR